jgi:phage-related protein
LYDYDNPSLAGYQLTNQCKNGWDKVMNFMAQLTMQRKQKVEIISNKKNGSYLQ